MTGTPTAVTLLDGGTGSELRRRGIAFRSGVWSAAAAIDDRSALTAVHRDYVDAGADLITANTFAAIPFVLEAAGIGNRHPEIVGSSIAAARDAIAMTHRVTDGAAGTPRPADDYGGRAVRVAAALSCYPPAGDPGAYPPAAAEQAAYHRNAELFARAGVDLILVEMLQDTTHGERACRAAAASGIPYWAGLSCRRHPVSGALVSFDYPDIPFAVVLERVIELGPEAIAIMHTPIEIVGEAVTLLCRHWSGPFGVYPELPYREDPEQPEIARTLAPVTPDAFAAEARHWLGAGATVIGGCCGTTPAHIAALRREIDARRT